MNYVATLVLLGSLTALPSYGQANLTDSQTLQALLVEVRELHNDVRLSESSQILLAELQLQQSAVTRAMQRRDNLRAQVSQVQEQERVMVAQIAQFEGRESSTIDTAQKKQMAQMQEQFKAQVANLKAQEPERANELADGENALRKEQTTLDNIQGQLDDVMKKLQPATTR
jgi:hypothetical protein